MVMTTSDACGDLARRRGSLGTLRHQIVAARSRAVPHVSSWPAFNRLAPIGWPINPNPINPTGGFMTAILLREYNFWKSSKRQKSTGIRSKTG